MNFFVIGTDHRFQEADPGLEGLLRELAKVNFTEPLSAIAEEYSDKIGKSIAQRLAERLDVAWFNLDLSTEERDKAGILEELSNRPRGFDKVTYRVPADDLREDVWVRKLTESRNGTMIAICGYMHLDSLVRKLRADGHAVDQRAYLEVVPEVKDDPQGS